MDADILCNEVGMNHRLPIALPLALVAAMVVTSVASATGPWKDQNGRIIRLRAAAKSYYEQTGRFPVSSHL